MSNKSGMEMDWKDFDRRFMDYALKQVPEKTAKGLREAAWELKNDADNVPPRTPHREGHLRGSGIVSKVEQTGHDMSISVSYGDPGVPYAARWHEVEPGTVKWSEPDVGPKYLESKMTKFREKYMKIVADNVKGG